MRERPRKGTSKWSRANDAPGSGGVRHTKTIANDYGRAAGRMTAQLKLVTYFSSAAS